MSRRHDHDAGVEPPCVGDLGPQRAEGRARGHEVGQLVPVQAREREQLVA